MATQPDQSALFLLVQQLQQELQNQRSEIMSLRSDVQRLQTQVSAPTRSPRPRLPDPPRFDGKPFTLRTWLPSIRAKLRSDQLAGADAFDYVWDRLEQPQQASILHLRQSAEEAQSWDPETVFAFFQRLCHNPREQQEAVQRYTSVRQREEESLIAYLARFERLAYEADASSWPDVSRVTTLHRGLRPALRQSLEESNDSLFSLIYDEYVELAQRYDRRTRRPQPAQSFAQPIQPAQPARKPALPTQPRQPEPMDIDPIRVSTARILPARPPSPSSCHASTPPTPSTERRAHRLQNNLCLYCGSNEHWIAGCPDSRPFSLSRSASPLLTDTPC